MIDIQEKKRKIISFLEANGPSLPVRIAKAIEMDPIVTSAITSELINLKQIKTSHIKIGASPLYLLPGQEQKLEEYVDNFKPIEKETFLKLKKNKLITDEDEEPATRVALRNIKDFAIPFKSQEKIIWKYSFTPEEEIKKLLLPPKEKEEKQEKQNFKSEQDVPKAWKVKKEEIKQAKVESKKIESIFSKQNKDIANNPLSESEQKKSEPEFLTEIKNFLKQKTIEFIEEVRTEKKEIMAIINIKSQLDDINFLLIAKNKKTVTKDEIEAAIQIAIRNKMPCLLMIRKNPSTSIQKLIDQNHLIKLQIIKT